MKHKIGDKVKWKARAQGRMKEWYRFWKNNEPKPHDLVGTIIQNYPTKICYTHGYFIVDFGNGPYEAVFGEDLKPANL